MICLTVEKDITACNWDVIIPFEPLWYQYKRIIKDNGAIVLTASQPFSSKLVVSNEKMFKYEWIWHKSNKTNFMNAKKMPLREHEQVLVFGNESLMYNPQGVKQVNKFTKQGTTLTDNYGGQKRDGGYFQEFGNYPSDVLKIKSQPTSDILHPTQKPVALFEYLIKTYTKPGYVVLDNCIGSGTTAIACINLGRYYIGIELESKYVDVSNDRIAKHTTQQKLFNLGELE